MNEFQLTRLYYPDKETLGRKLILEASKISVACVDQWFKKHDIVARYCVPETSRDNEENQVEQWILPWPEYERAMPYMHEFPYEVEMLPSPLKQMMKLTHECPIVQTQTVQDLLPPAFFQKLDVYQVEGIQYLLNRAGRGTIADEMGLGKTLQSIGLMMCIEEQLRRLAARSQGAGAASSKINESKVVNLLPMKELQTEKMEPEIATGGAGSKRKCSNVSETVPKSKKQRVAQEQRAAATTVASVAATVAPITSHLIICPATIRENWNIEFAKHLSDYDRSQVCIITSSKHLAECLSETKKEPRRKRKKPAPPSSIAGVRFWIMSYDLLVRDEVFTLVKEKLVPKISCLILDESQQIKTQTAIRTQRTTELANLISVVAPLSGTPGIAARELFASLQALQPGIFQNFWIVPTRLPKHLKSRDQIRPNVAKYFPFSFASRWCDPYMKRTFGPNFTWELSGSYRKEELYNVQTYWGFIRRTKRQVLTGALALPEKRREQLMVPVTDEDMKKIQEVQKQIAALESQPKLRDTLYMGLYHDLARIKSGFVRDYILHTLPLQVPGLGKLDSIESTFGLGKLDSIESTLDRAFGLGKQREKEQQKEQEQEKIEQKSAYAKRTLPAVHLNHDKCLLFAHHAVMIDSICSALNELGLKEDIDYVVVTGKTAPEKRQPKVSYFQNDSKCRIAVLGIRSAGSGLQMSKASLVIFTELDFEPGKLMQAESRAHRRGATKDVLILYLLAKGSIDEAIWNTIQRKEATGGELCDGKVRIFRTDAKQTIETLEAQESSNIE